MKRALMWMVAALGLAGVAMADPVEDSIDAARKAYEAGRYSEAIKELDFAAQLIRQKKAKQLEEVFPAPLSGWQAQKPRVQVAGRAFLGGGISAQRAYTKNEVRVQIEITMNNPMLQTF